MKTIKIVPFFICIFIFSSVALALVPDEEMVFGSMSEGLPEEEFREYWQKAYPEMEKIFGQPYSSFTFTVEVMPELKEHEGGWDTINKTVMSEADWGYKNFLEQTNSEIAINSVERGVTHELSHAMYTYDDKAMGFPLQWINEGWAKTTELITWMKVKNEPPRAIIYLAEFLDKNMVAGTQSWGRYKQKMNHQLVYDSTSVAHLTLLYACSDSNLEPNFQKRMNEKIYSEYVVKKKLNDFSKLPLEEYKSIIKELCAGKKIDGKDAYEWYFSQPASHIDGTTGFHLGVYPHYWSYTTVEGIDVFTFNRIKNTEDADKSEVGVNAKVKVEIFDANGNKVFSEEIETHQDGNSFINFGRDYLKDGSYYVTAEADYNGKQYQSKIFFINLKEIEGTTDEQAEAQPKNEILGVIVNNDLEPLDSRYISILKPVGDARITANSNGLFKTEASNLEVKEISFDFLEERFVFTKPPYRRLVVLQLSDDLIEKAEQEPEFKVPTERDLEVIEENSNAELELPNEELENTKELMPLKEAPPPPPKKTILHWLIEKLTRLFGFG